METTPTKSPKPKAKAKPRGKRARPTASAVKVEDASTALVATRGRGRPPRVARTEEIEEIILERLRDGETLRDICKSAGMPREAFVREWAAEVGAPFAESFRRARARSGITNWRMKYSRSPTQRTATPSGPACKSTAANSSSQKCCRKSLATSSKLKPRRASSSSSSMRRTWRCDDTSDAADLQADRKAARAQPPHRWPGHAHLGVGRQPQARPSRSAAPLPFAP